jgi:hypothetical protein
MVMEDKRRADIETNAKLEELFLAAAPCLFQLNSIEAMQSTKQNCGCIEQSWGFNNDFSVLHCFPSHGQFRNSEIINFINGLS